MVARVDASTLDGRKKVRGGEESGGESRLLSHWQVLNDQVTSLYNSKGLNSLSYTYLIKERSLLAI